MSSYPKAPDPCLAERRISAPSDQSPSVIDRLHAAREDQLPSMVAQERVTHIAVRKPHDLEWFQVHPEFHPSIRLFWYDSAIPREYYLDDIGAIPRENLTPSDLRLCQNRDGELFLWPISKKKRTPLVKKYLKAVEAASVPDQWAMMSTKELKTHPGRECKWPKMSMDEVLDVAFEDFHIDREDHPALLPPRKVW